VLHAVPLLSARIARAAQLDLEQRAAEALAAFSAIASGVANEIV